MRKLDFSKQKLIDIGNVTFQIIERYPYHNRNNMGFINQMDGTICISSGMPESQTIATLWHEVVHGVLDSIGESELSKNEDFVEKLSRALIQCATLKTY